jgi:hypothetical protein
METKFLADDSELHDAFGIIASVEGFSDYTREIIGLVYNNNLSRKNLVEILKKYKINKPEDIKEELLDVLIAYINLILNDHIISEKELKNVQVFKLFFKIHEGDFFTYRYEEIGDILNRQFSRMFRNDDKIDNTEAFHSVSLQKLFDLSYDQIHEFKEKEIIAALDRGAEITELDSTYIIPQAVAMSYDYLSGKIPQKVKDEVWTRDRGKCAGCGSNMKLEFDHIIPISKGGSNTYRNLQLLCEKCNRKKYNKIGTAD